MNAVIEKLLDLLFPPRCPFCRSILRDSEKLICAKCRGTLPWTPQSAGRQRFRNVEICVSPLYYDADVRRSLLRYKFGGMSVYAPKYAQIMAERIEKENLSFDLITWAPLGPGRRKRRGYDQACLLAQELSAILCRPCMQLLYKTADNPPQSGTGSAEKRRANVSGVYRAADPALLKNQRILIIDDIVTTGATLNECARTMKAAGAKSVCAATLARSRIE